MTQSPRFRSSSLLGMHILGTRVLRAPTVPAAPSPRRLTLPATPSSQNPEPQPLPQRGPKGLPGKGGTQLGRWGTGRSSGRQRSPAQGRTLSHSHPSAGLALCGELPSARREAEAFRTVQPELPEENGWQGPQGPSSDPGQRSLCPRCGNHPAGGHTR